MSELVKSMMDENGDDEDDGPTEIPLPNVKAQVLRKVIEFCEHHLEEPMTEIEKPLKSQNMADVVQKWYADFVDLEQVLLFELILAANFMDIKPLLDLTCATVASMIKGKTVSNLVFCVCGVLSQVLVSDPPRFVLLFFFSPRKSATLSTLPMIFLRKRKPRCERRTNGARKPRYFEASGFQTRLLFSPMP